VILLLVRDVTGDAGDLKGASVAAAEDDALISEPAGFTEAVQNAIFGLVFRGLASEPKVEGVNDGGAVVRVYGVFPKVGVGVGVLDRMEPEGFEGWAKIGESGRGELFEPEDIANVFNQEAEEGV
jgi:hypothetical protein